MRSLVKKNVRRRCTFADVTARSLQICVNENLSLSAANISHTIWWSIFTCTVMKFMNYAHIRILLTTAFIFDKFGTPNPLYSVHYSYMHATSIIIICNKFHMRYMEYPIYILNV